MDQKLIGVVASAADSAGILASIEQAEQLGVPAAWLTTGGVGLDALTLYAAAAVRTNRIRLGTSIVPTFPRHPLVVVRSLSSRPGS
jgi:alkanesulfonate monooxygenase SsuD/methylene tetrahydromethanopterin reductase-like flavin-dependent oxidoreductase (luciferase family)